MKKIIFSLVVMMTATLAFGQNSAIYKAEELLNENEIQKAQAAILPALTSDKTTHKAWAFNMAGNIESRILQKEIEKAEKAYPDVTFEMYEGDQPLYPMFIAAE